MAPCRVEGTPQGQKNLVKVDTLRPGDKLGFIAEDTEGQDRAIVFQCNGSNTMVYRAVQGRDYILEGNNIEPLRDLEELEFVIKLEEGETYEFDGISERKIQGKYKLTHRILPEK